MRCQVCHVETSVFHHRIVWWNNKAFSVLICSRRCADEVGHRIQAHGKHVLRRMFRKQQAQRRQA